MNAPKIVNSAIIGYDVRSVVINGKVYMLAPPTIHKIAGAGYYLSDIGEGTTVKEILSGLKDVGNAAHALSWFINDNDDLTEEISKGTLDEVVEALEEALSLISARNFLRLSASAKSVQTLTANQRQ